MADIRHALQVAAPPERIFPLVSTGSGLGEWWATDITQPGETVDLGFFSRATIYRLRPVSQASRLRAEWVCESGDEWGGTRLVFELEAVKNGSIIRFTHGGWRGESPYFISCNTTWGELMFRLKESAEGRKPGPLFTRDGIRR